MVIFKKTSIPTLGAKGMPCLFLNVLSGLEKQSFREWEDRYWREEVFGFEVLEAAESINP